MTLSVASAMYSYDPYWKPDSSPTSTQSGGERVHDQRALMMFQRISLAVQIIATIGLTIAVFIPAFAPFSYGIGKGLSMCSALGTITQLATTIWQMVKHAKSERRILESPEGKKIQDISTRVMNVFIGIRIFLSSIATSMAIIAFRLPIQLTILSGVGVVFGAYVTYSFSKELLEKLGKKQASI